ncbi:hypothetical protein IHE44_0005110 [Lamprotornis superbus]|uniref:Uncharacterized protein n=1 Tax=Lamprotornis superbus TaxID=245042 RepID=A0A835NQ12_9PASS|nr:hypothetical protein IHE44_0005110 [Lamprotornis superbus]
MQHHNKKDMSKNVMREAKEELEKDSDSEESRLHDASPGARVESRARKKLLRLRLASSRDVLLQEEQQNPLPIIPGQGQRSAYQLVAVHPKSDPSSIPTYTTGAYSWQDVLFHMEFLSSERRGNEGYLMCAPPVEEWVRVGQDREAGWTDLLADAEVAVSHRAAKRDISTPFLMNVSISDGFAGSCSPFEPSWFPVLAPGKAGCMTATSGMDREQDQGQTTAVSSSRDGACSETLLTTASRSPQVSTDGSEHLERENGMIPLWWQWLSELIEIDSAPPLTSEIDGFTKDHFGYELGMFRLWKIRRV